MAAKDMPHSLHAFVIGPESQGRGYRLLAPKTSPLPKPSDLAMVLMEWARTHEPEFVGSYTLPGGAVVVFRAGYLGKAMLGEEAFLHGVLIDARGLAALEGRSEFVLDQIPPPDGSLGFGERPLVMAPPRRAPPTASWNQLGLAWRDRLILTPPGVNREGVLRIALASIDPPTQRPRITGWVTSGRLVSRGDLNLLHDSQLVVADTPFEGVLPRHEAFQFGAPGGHEDAVAPPRGWLAWEDFRALIDHEPAYADLAKAMAWKVDYAQLTPEELIEELLRIASGRLPHTLMVDLLLAALTAGGAASRASRVVTPEYLQALKRQGIGHPPLQRVLEAVAGQPLGVTAALLGMADSAVINEISDAAFQRILPEALTAIQTTAAKREPALRAAVLSVLKRGISTGADMGLVSVGDIIASWPRESMAELLPLTEPDSFRTIYHRSRGLAIILASEVLDRRHYGVSAGGGTPVNTLESVLHAIHLLAEP